METFRKEIDTKITPAVQKALGLKNRLAVPRVTKITVNIGLNASSKDSKFKDSALDALTRITGQKPVETKARKSVSGFKVREGMVVGLKVTLRGARMYDFLYKLIHVTLPRIRDFQGLSKELVDATGNLSLGFKEHLAFPEIRSDEIEVMHGLQVTITTTAKSHDHGVTLFTHFGFPFINK